MKPVSGQRPPRTRQPATATNGADGDVLRAALERSLVEERDPELRKWIQQLLAGDDEQTRQGLREVIGGRV